MLEFTLTDVLEKKLKKLTLKNKVLILIFRRKLKEIISNDEISIMRYKNLRAP